MIKNIAAWLESIKDSNIRFLIYKRIFTPAEVSNKYIDQGEYTESSYSYGRIIEAVELPDKDVLLGIQILFDDYEPEETNIEYYKLSEIRLSKFERDNQEEDN